MKLPHVFPILLFALVTLHADPPPVGKNAVPLFDGKSLAGWEGNEKIWKVQDGAISGGSLTEQVARNEFLATQKSYADFDLRLKIKITGKEGFINSGVQIRSQRVPNDSEMSGYQCDAGEGWWGKIYDESRRNKVIASPADEKALLAAIKKDDWNDYVVRAEGARIRIWINGVAGSDYIEPDPKIPLEGKIGLQVHGGGKALIQFKDITIEELPKREGAPEPKKPDKPSPVSPEEQKASFTVPPGFQIELVVSEDEAKGYGKFIAVYFDQKGRLWTMTALEYPVDANENPGAADALYASKAKDKVLVYDIEDRGTNGAPPRFAREPTVFTDGLAIPLGILPYKDGCYVQHGHDLALLRDTDNDGKADKREIVLTGFGVQDSHLFPHQFTRAPGGWIWMAQGAFNYGKVVGPEGKAVQFDQTRMARFRPDGSEFEITSNGPCNIWGLVMNGEGETFIQEANDFGYPVMPFHEYANYPGCSNGQWKSYAPEFPATAEFRMGGTGLSGLALTDAAGAYPPEWSDVMLVANPIIRKIQTIKMHRDGSGWKLELLPDFVQSGDEWFRPIAMTLGPDGCVYIVDWYNKIISHNEVPRNHPERDKKRGRIWRVKHKDQKCFPVPDFTKLPEKEIVGKLGGQSLAQSHLAWQGLEDKERSKETGLELGRIAGDRTQTAAKRIQAIWAMGGYYGQSIVHASDPSPAVRRAAASLFIRGPYPEPGRDVVDYIEEFAGRVDDPDPQVRIALLGWLGRSLVKYPNEAPHSAVIPLLLKTVRASLPQPMLPSSQSNKPIKVGEAYEREFERYLVRMFLERAPEIVKGFLDSPGADELEPDRLMLAALSLPPKDSAPRVAKLIAKLDRAPSDEEILRLAEAPEAPEVKAALAALIAKPEGLQSLLRQKTKFDARVLAPLVEGKARELLATDTLTALNIISAFKLTALEPALADREVALRPDNLSQSEVQLRAPLLRTLRELGSKRADVFLAHVKSTDPSTRDEALAGLAAVPDKLIPLWSDLTPPQRSRALGSLTSSKPGAQAVVTAVNAKTIPQEELDGPALEKLAAILGESDPALKALMEKMGSAFRPVLVLDGKNESWVKDAITLTGPFTVECWVRLAPGIGNDDSILGWPNEADFNFYDGKFRVWVNGPHDVIIAKKPVAPDMWTHVAVTRDERGAFKIYLNGELDQAEGKPEPKPLKNLRVGQSNVPAGTGASLAEFRVWSVCRTPGEIRSNFDRTFSSELSAPTRPTGLVLECTGTLWGALNGSARIVNTTDYPPVLTAWQAIELDAKYAKYHALATKPGNKETGKLLATICIGCHTINATGAQLGPNLSGAGAMGVDGVLRNLLTPNAAMEPGYRVYRVEMTDGTLKEGFLVSEDDKAVIFRQVGLEDQRIPRDQIRRGQYLKRSLMPEGLLEAFSEQQVSDLFSYLMTLK